MSVSVREDQGTPAAQNYFVPGPALAQYKKFF